MKLHLSERFMEDIAGCSQTEEAKPAMAALADIAGRSDICLFFHNQLKRS
jgi:hypothetical protein